MHASYKYFLDYNYVIYTPAIIFVFFGNVEWTSVFLPVFYVGLLLGHGIIKNCTLLCSRTFLFSFWETPKFNMK